MFFFVQIDINILKVWVNLTIKALLHQDARMQDLYFNISEIKLSITLLFSVKIMPYLGASNMIYSDAIEFQRF